MSIVEKRKELAFGECLDAHHGWYHSMDFPDGTQVEGYTPLSVLRERYADFGLPDDLRGKRALDIGAWDGWFSFEMERHGADVTAVDVVSVPNFETAHRRKQSKVRYLVCDLYNLPRHNLGTFDYTLFLGVLYHLRHPLLGLEIVCGLTRETAIVDSFVVEPAERPDVNAQIPFCEFYETDELGGNLDNWFGPTTECLLGLCRSAGFARVRLINEWHRHARVICHRHWNDVPATPATPPPTLLDVTHSRNFSGLLSSHSDEYLTLWFQSHATALARQHVLPEVGEFAAPVLVLKENEPGYFFANIRVPPGLAPGGHRVRLRLADSDFSNDRSVFLDQPLKRSIEILRACDGVHWTDYRVRISSGAYLTFWVTGLPQETDLRSLQIYAADERLLVTYIGPVLPDGLRQINAQLLTHRDAGHLSIYLRQGPDVSNFVQVEIEP